ncbi:hypothetical protein, partial [Enterobacter hormaechei]
KRAYCLKTQPATGETYPKSDLFNKASFLLKINYSDLFSIDLMRYGMTESALLLREAFNESVNYMTWSFYSLITAYVSMAFYDRVEVKTRINNYLNKLLFVIAMSVFIPNMYFVSMVFSQKLGTAAGVASFIIGLLFMMLNSAPVITGIVQQRKD